MKRWGDSLSDPNSYKPPSAPTHVPAKWNPVRQGEPLFADKDVRQK
jgi:hypothetical protein